MIVFHSLCANYYVDFELSKYGYETLIEDDEPLHSLSFFSTHPLSRYKKERRASRVRRQRQINRTHLNEQEHKSHLKVIIGSVLDLNPSILASFSLNVIFNKFENQESIHNLDFIFNLLGLIIIHSPLYSTINP